ncbi:hypothetical protein CAPTEDRAFT_212548 [Capitella teleta]|uniref:Methyltransferase domain-containing protein n=1 Tax=Capitella teleta TaxID=283909 RepID=R7TD35_CAPTE|nr:hypothetical protein CAPTEDRAFT_212548 [Capitella teleta]|eukprot:ELT91639.1 hypothetical protein CAPTEDRAFT_212548 [Capitella teleta]
MAQMKSAVVMLPVCLCVGVVCVMYLQSKEVINAITSKVLNSTPISTPIQPVPYAAFDLDKVLSFLPYGSRDCIKLTETLETSFAWPERYEEAAKAHKMALDKAKGGSLEGHSGQIFEQQMVYVKLAQLPFVKTICETGFNAGHSTLIWLAAKNGTKVYSFDLGSHKYAKKMAQHLQSMYPGRLIVTWGDSTKTLPQFHGAHPEVKCDLIIVDGGHSVPIATDDFVNFRRMASSSNIVVFDDYPTKRGLGQRLASVWESQLRSGTLAEQYACTYG